jgi:Protein of unknown function DUF262
MKFECNTLSDSTVMLMYLERERIFLDPPYQRAGEVWDLYKKQLLIDSLINGFDIPKLYFHEYEKAEQHDGRLCKYAIIDGKQRLSAIWEFMDGKFALAGDIEYMRDDKVKLAGLKYDDLSREHPTVQARFTGRSLTIVTIRTDDTDIVDDMFSRLNEAVPLNAAEKRNAFGGPLPHVIKEVAETKFFRKVSIPKKRYRHYDLACKFLFLEEQGGPAETKKVRLDNFVKEYKSKRLIKKAAQLEARVRATLAAMTHVFKDSDPLLRSPAMAVTYYLLFRDGQRVSRDALLKFEDKLRKNQELAKKDLAKADADLVEFDRLSQAPNDKSAIEYRLKVLRERLGI